MLISKRLLGKMIIMENEKIFNGDKTYVERVGLAVKNLTASLVKVNNGDMNDLSIQNRFGIIGEKAKLTPIFLYDHAKLTEEFGNVGFTDFHHIFMHVNFFEKLTYAERNNIDDLPPFVELAAEEVELLDSSVFGLSDALPLEGYLVSLFSLCIDPSIDFNFVFKNICFYSETVKSLLGGSDDILFKVVGSEEIAEVFKVNNLESLYVDVIESVFDGEMRILSEYLKEGDVGGFGIEDHLSLSKIVDCILSDDNKLQAPVLSLFNEGSFDNFSKNSNIVLGDIVTKKDLVESFALIAELNNIFKNAGIIIDSENYIDGVRKYFRIVNHYFGKNDLLFLSSVASIKKTLDFKDTNQKRLFIDMVKSPLNGFNIKQTEILIDELNDSNKFSSMAYEVENFYIKM